MRSFAYQAPATVAEAVAILAARRPARPRPGRRDGPAGAYAPRSPRPYLLVDLNKIPELGGISFSPAAGLTVDAALSLSRVCAHPALLDAASLIGGAAIQGAGDPGRGNPCNAAPSADSIPAPIMLAAGCVLVGPQGSRTVPVAEFCTAPRHSVLGRGELLVSIHLPPP